MQKGISMAESIKKEESNGKNITNMSNAPEILSDIYSKNILT